MTRFRMTEALLVASGITLALAAVAAGQPWWDRHFLPMFAIEHSTLAMAEQTMRGLIAVFGVTFAVLLRRPIAAALSQATPGGVARVLLAIVLGLGASELILRTHPPHPHDADPLEREPRRQTDAWLGWVFVPARSVSVMEAGRQVSYSFDAAGYRIRQPDAAVDLEQPTVVFTGESIISGFGLEWEETIPARVGALLGIQSANMAVSDYSNDQAYLRLALELPRFRKPLAVVTLFMPRLFDRNLLDNRPSLAPGLLWRPANHRWRLRELLHWIVPYHNSTAIEEGITRTRGSLRALVELARARGAEPLIVVPQFGAETSSEEMLRRRILDEGGLPYVRVKLDPSWHLPHDLHPDPHAAGVIARAVAARLRDHRG
jgi:hypothetical protein